MNSTSLNQRESIVKGNNQNQVSQTVNISSNRASQSYKTPPKKSVKKQSAHIVNQTQTHHPSSVLNNNRENFNQPKPKFVSNAPQLSNPGSITSQKSQNLGVLKETQNKSITSNGASLNQSVKNFEQSNEIPESPCQLQITPQENKQSVLASQRTDMSSTQQQQQQNSQQMGRSQSQAAYINQKAKRSKSRGKDKILSNKLQHEQVSSPKNISISQSSQVQQSPNNFQQKLELFEQKLASDHLKSAICALNEKLKLYENIESERDNAREELEQADQARKELRSNIKETAERIKDDKDKNIKYQSILINENQTLSKQILMITEMFSKKVQEYDQLTFDFCQKEKDCSDVQLYNQNCLNFQDKFERESKYKEELSAKYYQVNDSLENKSKEYQKKVEEINEERNQLIIMQQQLIQENRDLKKQVTEFEDQVQDMKSQIDQMEVIVENKEVQIEAITQQLQVFQNIKEHNLVLQKEVQELKIDREQLTAEIQQNQETHDKVNKRLREEFDKIQKERACINDELQELFKEKAEKDVIIKTITNENLELTSKITILEQLLCAREDHDSKIDELQESYKRLNVNKEKYKNDLEICTNYLLEVEEKCQEAQKTSLELLQQLKEREQQIERLEEMIGYLQKNPVGNVFIYTPVKDDIVDKKLAEYINNAPIQLRSQMQFVREQEGVYKYGKKRVFMKIEGDQIIIRVGGGFLTIEEFLDQYCDGEESKKKLYGLIYQGNCMGSKDFKTFYFTQKTLDDKGKDHSTLSKNLEKDTTNSEDFSDEQVDTVGELKDTKTDQILFQGVSYD